MMTDEQRILIINAIDKLRESWMTDKEWETIRDEIIKNTGGWDKIEKDIEAGIGNGYSFETQLEIIKNGIYLFKLIK